MYKNLYNESMLFAPYIDFQNIYFYILQKKESHGMTREWVNDDRNIFWLKYIF